MGLAGQEALCGTD